MGAQSLATGTTASVAAGDLLVLPVLGVRNTAGSAVSNLTWSGGIGNVSLADGGGGGRSMGVAMAQQTAGGTKSATAFWDNSGATAPAIASILVFTVARAAPTTGPGFTTDFNLGFNS